MAQCNSEMPASRERKYGNTLLLAFPTTPGRERTLCSLSPRLDCGQEAGRRKAGQPYPRGFQGVVTDTHNYLLNLTS